MRAAPPPFTLTAAARAATAPRLRSCDMASRRGGGLPMTAFEAVMLIASGTILALIWNVFEEGRRHKDKPFQIPLRLDET
jgi:hypothetical protein